ncbi:homeobox domain-containing protein [Hamiltosporidium tvaerminnensis]|uniref:Homeobox domain-containing protein n=1 Tax=Hamiltosporidium tvaerminnensis TaxID=1176355 RepID=A0A4Q9LTS5_9MICR|nr:homeobox domain-containing protein [Hamiltosporidium tvaerminnensis]
MKFVNENEAQAALGLLKMVQCDEIEKEGTARSKGKFELEILSEYFNITAYPSYETRYDIAILLNISPKSLINEGNSQRIKFGSSNISMTNYKACIYNILSHIRRYNRYSEIQYSGYSKSKKLLKFEFSKIIFLILVNNTYLVLLFSTLISQRGTTLEEPTNNINEESDLEEETKVVKEVEENI